MNDDLDRKRRERASRPVAVRNDILSALRAALEAPCYVSATEDDPGRSESARLIIDGHYIDLCVRVDREGSLGRDAVSAYWGRMRALAESSGGCDRHGVRFTGSGCPCLDCAHEAGLTEVSGGAIVPVSETRPCSDCGQVIWFVGGDWYAADSGGVCEPCAVKRYGDRAPEYLVGRPAERTPE